MSAKLTPWFDAVVRPVRLGVYERDDSEISHPGIKAYSKWNGRSWGVMCLSPESAARVQLPSSFQNLPWRGLARNPSKQK